MAEHDTAGSLVPYRTPEVPMRIRDQETITFLAHRGADSISDPVCQSLALDLPQFDVFEAVAAGTITPNQGAIVFMMRRKGERAALPWFARAAIWLGELWRVLT